MMGIFTLADAPIKKTYKTWHEKSISEFCESAEGLTLLGLCNAASGLGRSSLESYIVRDEIGLLLPNGSNGTAINQLRYPALTAIGTTTARIYSSATQFAKLDRVGSVSAASAGSLCGFRASGNQSQIGSGTTDGFTTIKRFGCSDDATVAGARQMVGILNTTAAPTNVEPSTLVNSIGIGHGADDTNLKIYYGGSVAQTPIDLGANFPANTLSVDVYEIAFFSFKELSTKIGYQVKRLFTQHVARGILSAATSGVELPLPSTVLNTDRIWRCNNATALAVGIDLFASMRGVPNNV